MQKLTSLHPNQHLMLLLMAQLRLLLTALLMLQLMEQQMLPLTALLMLAPKPLLLLEHPPLAQGSLLMYSLTRARAAQVAAGSGGAAAAVSDAAFLLLLLLLFVPESSLLFDRTIGRTD
jgi:hypothetical protein